MIRLGILGSTRGTSMLALIDAIEKGVLSAKIQVVISNKPNAIILDRAKQHGVLAQYLPVGDLSRSDYDKALNQVLIQHGVELVVLIGYMRILSPSFVTAWHHKVINVHPSLLPAFAGMMDLEVHQAVLDAGIEETGCTVHYVTKDVDAGPILLQKTCTVVKEDNASALKAKVQQLEGQALVEAIQSVLPSRDR